MTETTARPSLHIRGTAPRFEIEQLGLKAEPEPQQKVWPRQRDVMAGGAIDLDEIAPPEMRGDESSAMLWLGCGCLGSLS